jgi:hypothetical protein
MPRIKVTITGYYEPEIEHYDGETDLAKMAAIDAENVGDDPVEAVMLMDEGEITITVEPEGAS